MHNNKFYASSGWILDVDYWLWFLSRYVLMCIHFLQLRRPAILPCLQVCSLFLMGSGWFQKVHYLTFQSFVLTYMTLRYFLIFCWKRSIIFHMICHFWAVNNLVWNKWFSKRDKNEFAPHCKLVLSLSLFF